MFKKVAPLALIVMWGLTTPAMAQIQDQLPAATCESTVTLNFPQPLGTFKVMAVPGNDKLKLETTLYPQGKIRRATATVMLMKGFKVYPATRKNTVYVIKDKVFSETIPDNREGLKRLILLGAIDLSSVRLQTKDDRWRLWWSFQWSLWEKPYNGPPRNSYSVKNIRIGPQAVRHGAPLPKSTWDIEKLFGTEQETAQKMLKCVSGIRGHRASPKKK